MKRFVDANSILKPEDKDESIDKINAALAVCTKFFTAFVAEKTSINTKYPSRIWSFEQEKVFSQLRQFEARLLEIRSVLHTIQDFSRLEKVEIGGTRVCSSPI